jgi:prefoldin alpha subunit
VLLLVQYYNAPNQKPPSDKTILVPLTNSLYVPGKLSDPEHVIVDVGTGYYIRKVCPLFIAAYSIYPQILTF